MRIISGNNRGMRINVPKGLPARPTTDMCKESLFNILETKFEFDGLYVLDLFSGTGNIAYEFASRGTKEVVAVELNFKSFSFIKSQSRKFGMSQIKVIRKDVFRFLEKTEDSYDIIFADPPYGMENISSLVSTVFDRELLKIGGYLILEHSDKSDYSKMNNFVNDRKYGQSSLSFFKNVNDAD